MNLRANSEIYGQIELEVLPSRDRRLGIERREVSAFDRLFKFQFIDRRKGSERRGIIRFSIERIPGFGLRLRFYDYSIATTEQLERFLKGIKAKQYFPVQFGRNFIKTNYDQADQRI